MQDEDDEIDEIPAGVKNYMTPAGYAALKEELRFLLREERPRIVEIVSWAAGNGDRSENGDYLYNKKRLREIDRRVRYLTKRTESAEVVDPRQQQGLEQVFFGATVTYARENGDECTVTLVGVDEADFSKGKINWLSPVARTLMKLRAGDTKELRMPEGTETIEVISVSYIAD
jgi:transcription elongation factor GreB